MLGLNRLASTVRGGFWLVRKGGLRQRLEELEQRAAALDRLDQQRWSELCVRLDNIVSDLGSLAGQVGQRLQRVDERTESFRCIEDERWTQLGARLEAFSRDVEANAVRTELRLSGIGDTAQGAHDRAFDAMRTVHQIDDLLRSRSRVFEEIARQNPAFFLHMGDFHYENIIDLDPARRRRA